MKATKSHTTVTDIYNIEDGPIIDTSPNRLRQGRFQVEKLSITSTNGEIRSVFIRGSNVLPDGSHGKLYHDRTLFPTEFPDWLNEFIGRKDDWL